MISREEVLKIAKLARLELSDVEVEKMQKDLSAILDYFDLLKKAPKPVKINSGVSRNRALRKDEIVFDEEIAKKIIEGFPNKQDNYIRVKSIL